MVIQRIQSLFLLLAVVCMAVYTFMPFAVKDEVSFTACDALPFLIVSIVTMLMLVINIFLYKDLRKQIRVAAINTVLVIATIPPPLALSYRCKPPFSIRGWHSLWLQSSSPCVHVAP